MNSARLFYLIAIIVGAILWVSIFFIIKVEDNVGYEREQELVVERTIFDVDGNECWVGNFPIFEQYDTSDQTVKITITCRYEVMEAHMPALERTQ